MNSTGDAAPVQDGHVEPRSSPGRSDLTGLYQLGRTLGRGHFAVVKLARQVDTGQLVAVKMIDKTKLDVMATSHLLQEVRCMRLVQHPNVVRLYEVIDTPTTLYLVMELAEGGDLYDYILRHEGGVAEATAKRHFAQIVRAVAYCHRLHVVHRDLKPENVVFFPQQGAVKLTDFGFSNLFQPGTMLATSCGSLAYSAPEILLGEEYDAPAVDVWSLGVILYMLVCGVPPFQETNDSETLVMILDCRYSVPQHVSDKCTHLISRMLQKDPSRRASLEEIEAHDWLQGLDSALLSPEAPPPWLSAGLSPSSPRSGAPECGDLLAARPANQQQAFPGPRQHGAGIMLRPPTVEDTPTARNLLALQQICEEEEEEEEEGELQETAEETKVGGASVTSQEEAEQVMGGANEVEQEVKEEEPERDSLETTDGAKVGGASVTSQEEAEQVMDGADEEKEAEQEAEQGAEQEVKKEEEEQEEAKLKEEEEEEEAKLKEEEEQGAEQETFIDGVISDQPIRQEDSPLHPPEAPPTSLPGLAVPCCQTPPDAEAKDGEPEPNNNTEKPAPSSLSSSSSVRSSSPDGDGKGCEHRQELAAATAARAEPGKRHSLKLRERLFQFPLCEKALAFNIPAHNKPKILPLAQYNCCHVL